MKDLLDKIKVLKVGAANSDYPVYAQYLYSKDGTVQSCNGKDFVNIAYDLPFNGLVNLFVLESFIKKIEDLENLEIYQEDKNIYLKSGVLTAKLNMLDEDYSSFPSLKIKAIDERITIDEQIIEILDTAFKFTGNNIYSYVYIGKDGIVASNMYKAFSHKCEFDIRQPIGITKKIAQVLIPGCEIALSDGNVVVFYNEDNFIIFSDLYPMKDYPYDKIMAFINKSKSDIEVCNMLPVRNALEKLSPILHNEKLKLINMSHLDNNIMDISAISEINGTSNYRIKILTGAKFDINMDASNLVDIPINFDIFYAGDDRLFLSDCDSKIAILGLV